MQTRNELLNDLIEMRSPISETIEKLRQFGWDSEKELVVLYRKHVVSLLNKYLNSDILAETVEEWANAIEGRDDIAFETSYESILNEAIHELANPALTAALDKVSAKNLLQELDT